MEFRRIIAFGKSSFVVSLPKSWLADCKLEKGDIVFLDQDDDHLIISPKEKEVQREEKRVVIKVDGKSMDQIKREIYSAYLTNIDYITLEGKDIQKLNTEITEVIHNLVALEIMEQDTSKIVAKDYLKITDISIKDHLKKIDIILRSIFNDLKDTKFKDFDELLDRRKYARRLYFLVFKVTQTIFRDLNLLKKVNITSEELYEITHLNMFYRNTLRYLRNIISIFKENGRIKNSVEPIEKISDYYIDVMKILFTKDRKRAREVAETRNQLIKLIDKKLNKTREEIIIGESLKTICRFLHQNLRLYY